MKLTSIPKWLEWPLLLVCITTYMMIVMGLTLGATAIVACIKEMCQ